MNCKFCGNFIPDGKDTCEVCGRRQDEQPIGQLLSDNMPNPVAAEEQREDAKKAKDAPAQKKGVKLPLALIAVSVLGWIYGVTQGVISEISGVLRQGCGIGTTQLAEDSGFAPGAAVNDTMENAASLGATSIAVLVLTAVGLLGLVLLFKRLFSKK